MTIGEIAKKCGVSTFTLRYYEKLGVIPSVPRNNGIRVYDNDFLKIFLFIQELKDSGMSLESIAKYRLLTQMNSDTRKERKQLLIKTRKKLQEKITLLQTSLNKTDYQLLHYNTIDYSAMEI